MRKFLSKYKKGNAVSEKLKNSEIRYRRLFESAKDGILILDYKTGRIVDANPFIIEILGYSLKETLGKRLWEIGLFSNKEQSELAFAKLKTNKYIRFEDMPIPGRNGAKTEVEFISNVYIEDNTNVIQCNIRDVTERVQAEKKQILTNRILSILNEQHEWQQLVNNILIEIKKYSKIEAVGIRLKDGEDFPYYETKGFPENFIQAEQYLCSRNKNGEIIYDEKGKPYLEGMYSNVISGRTDPSLPYFTKGGSFFSNNITLLLAGTTEKEFQSATRNRHNGDGYESIALIPLHSGKEIIGLLQLNDKHSNKFSKEMIEFFENIGNTIGIAFDKIQNNNKIRDNEQKLKKQNTDYLNLNKKYSDINEELIESLDRIQKMNEELIKAKLKSEESDKLKSVFLANMSHEIRTPVNAIMGFSNFLLKPQLSKEKIKNFVQIINVSSEQLLSVINDIVDISKIEAGQITVELKPVDINNLFDELYATYKKLVEDKKLILNYSCECPDELIQINTDRNRIKQIICNLLNNALKFTLKGEIRFGYKIQKNFIEFYVKDTGIGIATENLKLIFDRFRQVATKDDRVYVGNGLGLSISKALVEKLGGTITVNSEFGLGSTFTFTLPYIKEIENDAENRSKTGSNKLYNLQDKTVLIVEDNVSNYTLIKELLLTANIKMHHAWNGIEAVECVNKYPDISLVLMDIKLPIMDGYEATRQIKQLRPQLPVIAQTAFAQNHDRNQVLKAGCDNYIEKPIDIDNFMEVISNYLS